MVDAVCNRCSTQTAFVLFSDQANRLNLSGFDLLQEQYRIAVLASIGQSHPQEKLSAP
jgi:hypothetical protein